MSQIKSIPKGISRRDFLKGAGIMLVAGAATGLVSYRVVKKPVTIKGQDKAVLVSMNPINQDPKKCAGCCSCVLICSLYHFEEIGTELSRTELARDPFEFVFPFNGCQQCLSPSCYYACPLKDEALCIDEATGVRYVNADKCDGCGKCVDACPFTPPRIKIHPTRKVAMNCDLCRGRQGGPACVEYCPMEALSVSPRLR